MIWATVSSRSCFCWLYRASPSLAAKDIINLILILTIWWCPCVESSLVLLEEAFAVTSVFSWQNSVSLCPASSVLQDQISLSSRYFLTSYSCIWVPYNEKDIFFGVLVLEGLVNLPMKKRSFFSITGWGIDLDCCDIEWFPLEVNRSFCLFWVCIQVLHFGLFC